MANQHTKGAEKALTDQQQIFVDHFLKFGNGTRAAEHAKYAHPEIAACKLLSKTHIVNYIKKAIKAKAMGFAPDMIEQLAGLAMDSENVQAKDRIAAAVAVLDRAGVDNGRTGMNVNIDNSTKTVNVTGEAVQRLINETFNRGRGAPPKITEERELVALPAPDDEAEFEALPDASNEDNDEE